MKNAKKTIEKKSVICCLYDKVSKNFGSPSTFINENVAVRSFKDLLETELYSKHKEDYELYYLGDYDVTTGAIILGNMSILFRGSDLIV